MLQFLHTSVCDLFFSEYLQHFQFYSKIVISDLCKPLYFNYQKFLTFFQIFNLRLISKSWSATWKTPVYQFWAQHISFLRIFNDHIDSVILTDLQNQCAFESYTFRTKYNFKQNETFVSLLTFDWKLEYSSFRGRWSRSCYQTFEIQNDEQKFEGSILLKMCIQGFLGSMIKILSKFKMVRNMLVESSKKNLDLAQNLDLEVFEGLDNDL